MSEFKLSFNRVSYNCLILQDIMAEGDTVRTVVKFLSHEQSKEREEAVSLLHELSKSERLCEKIGSVNGAILIFVGMASSNSENVITVEKAEHTLENLARCENNVRQMAECGRLHPLLSLLLEGGLFIKLRFFHPPSRFVQITEKPFVV